MHFTAYLSLNYRTGTMTIRKNWPRDVGAYEIVCKLNINLEVPERISPTLTASIKMPEVALFEAVLEEEL